MVRLVRCKSFQEGGNSPDIVNVNGRLEFSGTVLTPRKPLTPSRSFKRETPVRRSLKFKRNSEKPTSPLAKTVPFAIDDLMRQLSCSKLEDVGNGPSMTMEFEGFQPINMDQDMMNSENSLQNAFSNIKIHVS